MNKISINSQSCGCASLFVKRQWFLYAWWQYGMRRLSCKAETLWGQMSQTSTSWLEFLNSSSDSTLFRMQLIGKIDRFGRVTLTTWRREDTVFPLFYEREKESKKRRHFRWIFQRKKRKNNRLKTDRSTTLTSASSPICGICPSHFLARLRPINIFRAPIRARPIRCCKAQGDEGM
jgi:hypothetical protein